jgi:hypothetical protein
MSDDVTVAILPDELSVAQRYADLSEPHTQRKLELQRSRHAGQLRLSNIVCGRVSRAIVARTLTDRGVPCRCDDSPATDAARYCIETESGLLVQVRFATNRPNYTKLLEDVRSFEFRPHHFYVGVTTRDGFASLTILGYATRDEMSQRPPIDLGHGVLNRYVALSALHPFAELVEVLRAVLHGPGRDRTQARSR